MANAKPTRGRIGNTSPNKTPNTQKPSDVRKSVRVLRALDPFTFKTLQRGNPGITTEELNNPVVTKNQVTQAGKRLLGGKRQSVRRLFRKDPYNLLSATAPPPFAQNPTVAMFSPEAENVDAVNPNPSFHPEEAPGAVTIHRQPQAAAGRKNRGHVIPPNRFTLFGGKTLRRK
jgi:hypothetical protein